jgi:hypothetical protein
MASNNKLTDPTLRAILANEKLIWRRLDRLNRVGFISLEIKTGFITALYRVQHTKESEKTA